MDKDKLYSYKGPIYDNFGNRLNVDWYGETLAPSKEKAMANLKYQYRKEFNLPFRIPLNLDRHFLSRYDHDPNIQEVEDLEEDQNEQLSLF